MTKTRLKQPDVNGPRRAVVYVRIGKESNDVSVAEQMKRLMAFCDEQRFRVVGSYTDVASGLRVDRQGLRQLLSDAEDGRFDLLVVQRLDRLSRAADEVHRIVRKLDAAGIALRTVAEGIDSGTSVGRFVLHTYRIFHEFGITTHAERTRIGIQRAKSAKTRRKACDHKHDTDTTKGGDA